MGEGEEPDPADDISKQNQPGAPVVTQLGDIWRLGEHLVCCGSARGGASLTELLDGEVADVLFTDPPYNVKINGHVRKNGSGFAEFGEASGEMSRADFVAFLVETLGNAVAQLKPGGVFFTCMDWRHIDELTEALEALKVEVLNICVWVKTRAGMGSLYRSQHELVFVARRPGAGHQNNVQLGKHGRNRSNVWSYAGATGGRGDPDDSFDVHPTVKPIRMVMDALLDVSSPGDWVVDPFLGSGTTLLEQMIVGHPDAVGTDETGILGSQFITPLVWQHESAAAALDELRGFDDEQLVAGRETYLHATEQFIGEEINGRLLIEKEPLMTADLPLPLRLLPEASILMPLRDPRDVLVSYFFTMVPLNWNSAPAGDIVDAAHFYADVMRHWLHLRDRLPNPWLEPKYEELAADPEPATRKVASFLGLSWDDALLDRKQRSERKAIRTPTYDDITKPITTRAVGRWKRYEAQLEPAMDILGPYVEAFGYDG